MQHVPLILFALGALASLILLVRSRWPALAPRTRKLAVLASALAILVFLFSYATHWTTASDRTNAAFYWAATAGYLLLLAIHSLSRPRWLTSITAFVLALPILASSVFLPLGKLFLPTSRRVQSLGHHLYASWAEFTELGTSSSGVDIDVFYRPALLPFLQRSRLAGRFYTLRCNAPATRVELQPDHTTVFVRCPSWPDSPEPDPGEYIKLH